MSLAHLVRLAARRAGPAVTASSQMPGALRYRMAFGPEAGIQLGSPYWPFTRDGEQAEHVLRSVDGDWPWDRWYWQVVQLRILRPVEGPVLGTSPKVVWPGYAATRAGAPLWR